MRAIKNRDGENKGYLFTGKGKIYPENLFTYPYEQFKRDSYLPLNGLWDLEIKKDDKIPDNYSKRIQVPFPLEALDSLVSYLPKSDDVIFYRRLVKVPEEMLGKKLILHFEGVDDEACVFIDGEEIGEHKGMALPFSFEIPSSSSMFELVVRVKDRHSKGQQMRGKQELEPNYWTYTTTTGIYKPVWIEAVEEKRILNASFIPDFEKYKLKVKIETEEQCRVELKIDDLDFTISSNEEVLLDIGSFHMWSFEDPHLYSVTVKTPSDSIASYFAIRKVEIRTQNGFKRLFINGKPLFLSGLLDQGYYGFDSLTPRGYEDYKRDIDNAKKAGFNCLRVHMKVECDAFYSYADKVGMYIIQDIPSGGGKIKLVNTISPRALSFLNKEKHVNYKKLSRTDASEREKFVFEAKEIVKLLKKHPSVIITTIFNEGWGEFDPSFVYKELKKDNPDHLFDTASGWYEADESDFFSVHTYTFPAMKRKNRFDRCFIISEAGGVGLKMGETPFLEFNGHGKCKKQEVFKRKVEKLYLDKVLPKIKRYGLCGVIYTQLADVETEYNGLYDCTRETLKINSEKLLEINNRLYSTYYDAVIH